MKLDELRVALAEPAPEKSMLFAFDSLGRALYEGCIVNFEFRGERVGVVTDYDPKLDAYKVYDEFAAERRVVKADRLTAAAPPEGRPVPGTIVVERLGFDRDGAILHNGDLVNWNEPGGRRRRSKLLGLATSPQFDYIVIDSCTPSGTRELARGQVRLAWPAKAGALKKSPKL